MDTEELKCKCHDDEACNCEESCDCGEECTCNEHCECDEDCGCEDEEDKPKNTNGVKRIKS